MAESSDREEDRKSLAWKLFDKIIDDLPRNNQTGKKVSNLASWNATDLLPDIIDRSFFSFNRDPRNNFVVFEKPIKVPSAFEMNLIRFVVGTEKHQGLMDVTVPPGPPANLVIFGKKNRIDDPDAIRKMQTNRKKVKLEEKFNQEQDFDEAMSLFNDFKNYVGSARLYIEIKHTESNIYVKDCLKSYGWFPI